MKRIKKERTRLRDFLANLSTSLLRVETAPLFARSDLLDIFPEERREDAHEQGDKQ